MDKSINSGAASRVLPTSTAREIQQSGFAIQQQQPLPPSEGVPVVHAVALTPDARDELEKFIEAAGSGDVPAVLAYLGKGKDVAARPTKYSSPALVAAVQERQVSVVHILLGSGAAKHRDDLAVARVQAELNGDAGMVQLLDSYDAYKPGFKASEPQLQAATRPAETDGSAKMPSSMVDTQHNRSELDAIALDNAARLGDIGTLYELIVTHRIPINLTASKVAPCALARAAQKGHPEAVEFLLRFGAGAFKENLNVAIRACGSEIEENIRANGTKVTLDKLNNILSALKGEWERRGQNGNWIQGNQLNLN